ncbi:MAG: hypothetical protein AABY32_02425 [Nanoarchaeota archaeon]
MKHWSLKNNDILPTPKVNVNLPIYNNPKCQYRYKGEGMLDFTNSGLEKKDNSPFNEVISKGYIFDSNEFNYSWSDNKLIFDLIKLSKLVKCKKEKKIIKQVDKKDNNNIFDALEI